MYVNAHATADKAVPQELLAVTNTQHKLDSKYVSNFHQSSQINHDILNPLP